MWITLSTNYPLCFYYILFFYFLILLYICKFSSLIHSIFSYQQTLVTYPLFLHEFAILKKMKYNKFSGINKSFFLYVQVRNLSQDFFCSIYVSSDFLMHSIVIEQEILCYERLFYFFFSLYILYSVVRSTLF